jgi:hypothetical protein
VSVRLAAQCHCVPVNSDVKTHMGLLTDILIAPETDGTTIFQQYPQRRDWPALELKGLDNMKLASLLRALGEDAEASELEGERYLAASTTDGPWVFLLPNPLCARLAQVDQSETADIAARWVKDEELVFDEWSAEDVAPLIDMLRSHAAKAAESHKRLFLWMSL